MIKNITVRKYTRSCLQNMKEAETHAAIARFLH